MLDEVSPTSEILNLGHIIVAPLNVDGHLVDAWVVDGDFKARRFANDKATLPTSGVQRIG